MRAARVVTAVPLRRPGPPGLVLAAHGSADPRSPAVTHALAGRIRRLRPWLDVRVSFLEQCGPDLASVLADVARRDEHVVVVPLLLASAYHARVDLPAVVEASGASVRQAAALGEDPALIALLGHRLAEAGVPAEQPGVGVIVVAVGSSNDAANARTATVGTALAAGSKWAGVEVAFATGAHPNVTEAAERLRDRGAKRCVIAPWFLANGRITDRVARTAAALSIPMTEPLGSHNLVAATLLDRYDEALAVAAAA